MATEKTAKANSILSARSRAGLAARREPYWHRVEAGAFVGYRVLAQGMGTWNARWRDPVTGKQNYRPLGTYPEGKDADGKNLDAFGAASKDARAWFASCAVGVKPARSTVADVCGQYVESLRVTKGASQAATAATYFRRLIDGDAIAGIDVDRLQADHLQQWRERISKPQARVGRGSRLKKTDRALATINRDIVPLRAALNLALERGLVASDAPWRGTLKPIKGADRRREVYLNTAERTALVENASTEFASFLRVLCRLPIRPGAAAKLRVTDFDRRTSMLTVPEEKGHAPRKIMLPDATAAFIAAQCKDKLPAAFVFTDANGTAWTKDSWKGPWRDAVTAAKVRADAVLYSIRHSVITDLVTAGTLDLLTIAQIAGTSVLMIQDHYGQYRQDHAANGLAALTI